MLADVAAQPVAPPPSLQAISTVLQDRNGDFVPDRLGETVTVTGRATVASGILRTDQLDVFLQDDSGGLRLRAAYIHAPIALGDSLVATGVLEQVNGMAQLTDPAYHVIRTPAHVPEPFTLDLSTTRLETYEGRLTQVEGYVAGKGRVNSGSYLNLAVGDSILVAFIYNTNGNDIGFDDFHNSDYVRITGLIGQFDRVAPYTVSYQIYPRYAEDIERAGIPPRMYRNLLLGISAILLAVLGWAYLLKREVRRRLTQLESSEMRYQLLFRHAGDALFVYPLQDAESNPLIEVNPVTCAVLHYPEGAMTRLSLSNLLAEGQHPRFATHLQHLRERQQVIDELVLVTQDGRAIPFEISSHVFTLDDQRTVLSVARDMTKRKAYEEGLIKARQEAEAMATLKSAFLANMSHEIRTPLTAIIGFADVLTHEVQGPAHEFTYMIRDSGHRLLATLDAILDLTRLDAKTISLHPTAIDLVEEVAQTVNLLMHLAHQKNLQLRFESVHQDMPAVQDVNGLHRIINNLVSNAIKFTEHGDVVVRLERKQDHACIQVTDSGIGMDEAFLPVLFDEFKQESTGLSRAYQGNGLGLAITHRLVDMMGGQIRVESQKGHGSTFTVELPLVSAGEQAAVSRTPPLASKAQFQSTSM